MGITFENKEIKKFIFSQENVKTIYHGAIKIWEAIPQLKLSKYLAGDFISGSYANPEVSYIGDYAFANCSNLSSVNLENCSSIGTGAFQGCTSLSQVSFPNCSYIGSNAFANCTSLDTTYFLSTSFCALAHSNAFSGATSLQSIYVTTSLLSSYVNNSIWSWYFSKIKMNFTPTECTSLSITADDCKGTESTTTIHYTAVCNGFYLDGSPGTETVISNATSEDFGQNPSYLESRTVTISFTYLGKTATTTITQSPGRSYTLTISGISSYGFTNSTVLTLDQTVYDGPYQSTNYNVNNSYGVARIDFVGYTTFTVWINSYAEGYYDYTIASSLDAGSYPTSGGDSTYGFQYNPSSGLSTSYWKKITYTTDGGNHHIFITYRKDTSVHSNYDRGYFVIERNPS